MVAPIPRTGEAGSPEPIYRSPMRGTNYKVGFGVGIFFLLMGVGIYYVGAAELIDFTPGISDRAAESVGVGGIGENVLKMIGAIWTAVALLLLLLFAALRIKQAGRDKIASNGIPGQAVVVAAETTNTTINFMPQYRLVLDVHAQDGRPPVRITKKDVVPLHVMGRWGIGTPLPVRVDPGRGDDVEILWDQLPAPGMVAPQMQAPPQPPPATFM